MNWEQKLAALQAITETSLCMRKPGDWYVHAKNRAIGGNGFLRGDYGNGKSPKEAVEDDWCQVVEFLPADRHIDISGYKPRKVRWNGFMWSEAA